MEKIKFAGKFKHSIKIEVSWVADSDYGNIFLILLWFWLENLNFRPKILSWLRVKEIINFLFGEGGK